MAIGWVVYTAMIIIMLIIAKPVKSEAKATEQQIKEQISSNGISIAQAKSSAKGARAMENGKPVINAPNGNVFYGTNSGTVNQNITNEFPEPKFELKTLEYNVLEHGRYVSKMIFTIDHKAPLKNLYLEAKAPSITGFSVGPVNGGGIMLTNCLTGEGGEKLAGKGFVNIPSAYGQYNLFVTMTKPEHLEILYIWQ
jgi:hypothetical protein